MSSQKEAKGNIVRAIESVSKLLGNTPTICRKCYVHPEVLESYLQGETISTLKQRGARVLAKQAEQLKPEEAAVMAFLQARLKRAKPHAPTKASDLAGALAGSLRKVRGRNVLERAGADGEKARVRSPHASRPAGKARFARGRLPPYLGDDSARPLQ